MVNLHGAGVGNPIDLQWMGSFALYRDLGVNVIHPVLPKHGPRRRKRSLVFPSPEGLVNFYASSQAIWDVRRTIMGAGSRPDHDRRARRVAGRIRRGAARRARGRPRLRRRRAPAERHSEPCREPRGGATEASPPRPPRLRQGRPGSSTGWCRPSRSRLACHGTGSTSAPRSATASRRQSKRARSGSTGTSPRSAGSRGRTSLLALRHCETLRAGLVEALHGERRLTSRRVSYNLSVLFELVADAVGDRTAVIAGTRREFTYAQLDERANRLAHFLAGAGVAAGDHVGLLLMNGTEYLEGMLAAFKLRAVPVNVNYRYVSRELEQLFANADLVALVAHRRFGPMVAEVAPQVASLRHLITVDDDSGEVVPEGSADYAVALRESSPARDFEGRSSADLYIAYTGGTTGMPKGVLWRHEDVFFASMGGGDPTRSEGPITAPEELVERILPVASVQLVTAPLMHVSGHWGAFATLYSGGTVVLLEPGPFDPVAVLDVAARVARTSSRSSAMRRCDPSPRSCGIPDAGTFPHCSFSRRVGRCCPARPRTSSTGCSRT